MTAVLGINCSGFHSSACICVDGRLSHAVCEERLSRVKQDRAFPVRAIEYCCDAAGVAFSDVEHVFVGWHPSFYLARSDRTVDDALRNRGKLAYLALNELAALTPEPIEDVTETVRAASSHLRIQFVDHHKAHAASAFYQSGFEKA